MDALMYNIFLRSIKPNHENWSYSHSIVHKMTARAFELEYALQTALWRCARRWAQRIGLLGSSRATCSTTATFSSAQRPFSTSPSSASTGVLQCLCCVLSSVWVLRPVCVCVCWVRASVPRRLRRSAALFPHSMSHKSINSSWDYLLKLNLEVLFILKPAEEAAEAP